MAGQNLGGGAFVQAPLWMCWKAQFNCSMKVIYGFVGETLKKGCGEKENHNLGNQTPGFEKSLLDYIRWCKTRHWEHVSWLTVTEWWFREIPYGFRSMHTRLRGNGRASVKYHLDIGNRIPHQVRSSHRDTHRYTSSNWVPVLKPCSNMSCVIFPFIV